MKRVKTTLYTRFMKSKPISYFRELSVVVIGVLITLSITQGITYCSKQNEVRHTLTLIKTELADNIENINCAQKKWETELRIYALLRENIDNLKAIPLDTLSRYSNVIGDKHSINCVSDA